MEKKRGSGSEYDYERANMAATKWRLKGGYEGVARAEQRKFGRVSHQAVRARDQALESQTFLTKPARDANRKDPLSAAWRRAEWSIGRRLGWGRGLKPATVWSCIIPSQIGRSEGMKGRCGRLLRGLARRIVVEAASTSFQVYPCVSESE